MTILNGKTYIILNKFIEEGRKEKSVIYATPEGNFLSPKAVEQVRQEERKRATNILEELIKENSFTGEYEDKLIHVGYIEEAIKILNS